MMNKLKLRHLALLYLGGITMIFGSVCMDAAKAADDPFGYTGGAMAAFYGFQLIMLFTIDYMTGRIEDMIEDKGRSCEDSREWDAINGRDHEKERDPVQDGTDTDDGDNP